MEKAMPFGRRIPLRLKPWLVSVPRSFERIDIYVEGWIDLTARWEVGGSFSNGLDMNPQPPSTPFSRGFRLRRFGSGRRTSKSSD
jgi:hypothetical protein